jgi:MFS family permease
MTIHMRQLGITVEETAFVYAILPLTQIFGGPISGFIADKIGNYKPVLLISLILCIVSSITIMFVPTSGDPNAKHRFALIYYSNHIKCFQLLNAKVIIA